MITVATGGPRIKSVDADYFDDLWRWYGRWSQRDMPRYQDRREFVAELFAPVRRALAELGAAMHELVEGVSEGPAGWPQIDDRMQRLRKLFREARDADAYNGVGLQRLKILTLLGRVVFDPTRDLPDGEDEPGIDDAKARIALFVRRAAPGKSGENLRKLVNAAYAQANAAKHRHTATRIDAGVTANATALIVSTLRLLDEGDHEATGDDLMSDVGGGA